MEKLARVQKDIEAVVDATRRAAEEKLASVQLVRRQRCAVVLETALRPARVQGAPSLWRRSDATSARRSLRAR